MKKTFFAFCFLILSFPIFCEEVKFQEFVNILRYDSVANIKRYANTFITSLKVFDDNSIDFYQYGGWEKYYLNPIDNDNQMFSITDEVSNIVYYAYRNSKTLCLFEGYVVNKETNNDNSHKIINHIYSGDIWGDPELKIKIGEDSIFYIFEDGEWQKDGYVNFFDEDSNLSFKIFNNAPYPEYVGFFSPDGNQLYIGFGDSFMDKDEASKFSQYIYPKLTLNSIKIGDINFKSSPKDILLFYPTCRIDEDGYIKEYIVDDYLDFDSITYSFNGNQLITILEEKTEFSNRNNEVVTSLVQRKIKELTELYGRPEIFESTLDYSKLDGDFYYSYHITREYTWTGEIGIKLTYDYKDRYGIIYNPSCKILYTQDIFDLD